MMRRFSESDEAKYDPESEEAKKREAFKVFDMDGNGYIDKHELRYVMRRLGENLSDEDLHAMFKAADLNEDGLIDFEGESLIPYRVGCRFSQCYRAGCRFSQYYRVRCRFSQYYRVGCRFSQYYRVRCRLSQYYHVGCRFSQ